MDRIVDEARRSADPVRLMELFGLANLSAPQKSTPLSLPRAVKHGVRSRQNGKWPISAPTNFLVLTIFLVGWTLEGCPTRPWLIRPRVRGHPPLGKETDVSRSTSIAPDHDSIATSRRVLWWPGLAFAAGGAVVATVIAAAADAIRVSLVVGGEGIPLFGFTQLAFVFSVVGVVLAAAFRKWSRRPAAMFVRTSPHA
ncbi:DUF6069 family protein [Streptomyces sp. NPDC056663]|uniref:DUF6069 family protein n=1 Tax=Streptomyces sp. NPDC056663 TaxID=3345899 RepID=UPI0036A0C3B4